MFCDYTDKNGKPYTLSYKCCPEEGEEHCPMEEQCSKDDNEFYSSFHDNEIKTEKDNK